MSTDLERQRMYATLYDISFSPCGRYIITCDCDGLIGLYSLKHAFNSDARKLSNRPASVFRSHDSPVYCLANIDGGRVLTGGIGEIKAWSWKTIIASKNSRSGASNDVKSDFTLTIPATTLYNQLDVPEVNSMAFCSHSDVLYSGGGDNLVNMWDLETGVVKQTLPGHTDFIHKLAIKDSGNLCFSASEDGTVRCWDVRTGNQPYHTLTPGQTDCARPALGDWIGCLAIEESSDWLVCGGGPTLGLWHQRNWGLTCTFPTGNYPQQVATFYEDSLISGGQEPFVYHWSMNGEQRMRTPCSMSSIFALATFDNNQSHAGNQGDILLTSGASNFIDVFTNFCYKSFSLEFY